MKYMIPVLTAVVFLSFAAPAMADPCAPAKREMIYGKVALQDAKDKQGYLESARQFEAAVEKAPSCAPAHFNLGIVYEKAGEYQKALNALQKYLSLAPKAPDADKVQKKIYELEYHVDNRIKQQAKEKKQRKTAYQIGGMWENNYRNQKFQIVMNGNLFDIYMVGSCRFGDCNRGWVKANQHDYTGTISENGEISGFTFVSAMGAEALGLNGGKEGVPCKVSVGWYPTQVDLSEQGNRMTLKSKIPYRNPFCGSESTELTLIR